MKRIGVVLATVLWISACVSFSFAEQPEKVYRVGLLGTGPPSFYTARFKAFREELRNRGYVEGRNIRFEYRYANGKRDRLPALAAELVRLKVDAIVSISTPATRAAMMASRTIPIVMNAGSPVQSGLVASLARPGGNVTGVTIYSGPEFYTKRLGLLKEIKPSVARIAVLWNPGNSAHRTSMTALKAAAPKLGVALFPVSTKGSKDIENTLDKLEKERPDALLAFGYPAGQKYRKRIVAFAAQRRVPAIWTNFRWMDSGGFMAYTVDQLDNARLKAIYVDKILKGARPADLPVQRPRKYELIVNLKAARDRSIAIPPEILLRATKVIK